MHYRVDHWLPSPDGGSLISFIQPILWRNDVHAPESPVVAVSCISVLLHLKCVVLDIIYRRKDYPGVIFFHSGEDRLRPALVIAERGGRETDKEFRHIKPFSPPVQIELEIFLSAQSNSGKLKTPGARMSM